MYRVVLIKIALIIVCCNTFAYGQDFIDAPNSEDTIVSFTVRASPAEISLMDRLAAGRDLLFRPSRVLDYWPEYRYEYSDVVDKFQPNNNPDTDLSPCADKEAANFILGEIAVVWIDQQVSQNQDTTQSEEYFGWPIVKNDNHTLDVQDFCESLQTISGGENEPPNLNSLVNLVDDEGAINIRSSTENSTGQGDTRQTDFSRIDTSRAFIVTSQALPFRDLEFERVDTNFPVRSIE